MAASVAPASRKRQLLPPLRLALPAAFAWAAIAAFSGLLQSHSFCTVTTRQSGRCQATARTAYRSSSDSPRGGGGGRWGDYGGVTTQDVRRGGSRGGGGDSSWDDDNRGQSSWDDDRKSRSQGRGGRNNWDRGGQSNSGGGWKNSGARRGGWEDRSRSRRSRSSRDSQQDSDSSWNKDSTELTKEEREARFRKMCRQPVTLTTFIQRAESPEELLWTIATSMEETNLNAIHIAASFSKLAALKKPFAERIRRSRVLIDLARQAARVADRRDFRARETASVLMSMASLRKELPWLTDALALPLLKWVPEQASQMTPQALSNSMWGIGVMDLQDSEASEAIRACADASVNQLGRFSNMDLAQTAWGLGAREKREESAELMDALGKLVIDMAPAMEEKSALMDLPLVAVAFARLGVWKADVMDAIARRLSVRNVLMKLRLWSLAALVWSWSHPSSPGLSDGQENRQPESREPEWNPATFLSRLQKEAERRRISQADIDRAPEGPKGETSRGWSSKGSAQLKGAGDSAALPQGGDSIAPEAELAASSEEQEASDA